MKATFEHNGIYFYEGTPKQLCNELIHLYHSRQRIKLDYGDTQTNKSWGETYDVDGYVGKTTGIKPMLILLHNSRSSGGGLIGTNCILSIKTSWGKKLIYQNSAQKE